MKPIKFRGRVLSSDKANGGKLVYGSYVEYSEGAYKHWIYPLEGYRNYPVERKSVVQLIGYDRNGNEVYEGDILVYEDGREFTAEVWTVATRETPEGEEANTNFANFTLKEPENND